LVTAQGLAVLASRPQAARPQQHDDDHGQGDQQLAQDGGVDAATGQVLQRPAT
jgi:hypothetical protein